jgi:hypothetical protein
MRNRRRLTENTRSVHIRDTQCCLTDGVETVHLEDMHVQIAWRATPFDGKRAYFVCPECSTHVQALYAAPNLACRRCHHLAYRSENLTPLWRRNEKLRKLQEKAGADRSRLPCILAKPKWMRWHTYLSLRRKIQEADRNFAAAWMKSRHGAMLCRERAV